MDKRQKRRQTAAQKKLRAKRILKDSWGNKNPSEREIGKTASTHGAGCSCTMCGNPRKHFGEKTRQEILQELRCQDED